ncbi:MAG: hypothetical protein WAU36_16750 [Cyclobacteriaceae bacterium]
MKNLVVLLLLALPAFTFAQSQSGVQYKLVSVEELELDELQVKLADRIEAQYQERLVEAMKIITVDRKEAHLKIAFAILSANEQYLNILNKAQRDTWKDTLTLVASGIHQRELQLNSEGKSRTIALVVR